MIENPKNILEGLKSDNIPEQWKIRKYYRSVEKQLIIKSLTQAAMH